MPGPPPKADSQRRRRNAPLANTRILPAEGRDGELPAWPLKTGPEENEATIWAGLWSTPQATAWEQLGWDRIVARYARMLALAEEKLQATLLAETRSLEDRLGLTPMSMLRLRWEIAPSQERKLASVTKIEEAPKPQRRLIIGGDDG